MTLGIRRSRWPLALLACSPFAQGWAAIATSPPRLVYNASDSVPVGWYRISPTNSLAPDDLMLVHLLAGGNAMQWLHSAATCWRTHRG